MALQGTLDTFALADVLQLLATTSKTGCLRLEGPRGTGTVHVEGGQLVAVAAAHAPLATEAADALFELLRFEDGAFTFEAGAAPDERGPATDIGSLLEAATSLLEEWHEIETVVPSLDAYVSLRSTLDGDDVTIPAHQWAHLAAIGGGRTVRSLGEHLELAELPVSRVVRNLLELGVVELLERAPAPDEGLPAVTVEAGAGHPDATVVAAPPATDDAEPAPVDGSADPTPAPAPGPFLAVGSGGGVPAPRLGAFDLADDPADDPVDDAADDPASALEAGPDGGLPMARPIKAHRPRPRLLEVSDEPERFVPLDLPGARSTPPATEATPAEHLGELTAAFPGLAGLSADPDSAVSERPAVPSPEAPGAARADAGAPDEDAIEAAHDGAVEAEEAPRERGLLLKLLGPGKS